MLCHGPRIARAPAGWIIAATLAAPAASASAEPPVSAPSPVAKRSMSPDAEPSASEKTNAEPPAATAAGGEVIEVTGAAAAAPGSISLDAEVARQTAGALGEP